MNTTMSSRKKKTLAFDVKVKKMKMDQIKKFIQDFGKKRLALESVRFHKRLPNNISGSYSARKKTINISLAHNKAKQTMLRTFFHECAHHYAVQHNLWTEYHYYSKTPKGETVSKEEAFEIENSIDIIAQKLWNRHVSRKDWGCYKFAYPAKNKKSLMKFLEAYYGN